MDSGAPERVLTQLDRPQKGKGRLKREATEAEIINAFDRVVRRDGLRNVGVNTVIKEAGIGKGLLYNYFGGLPGLVKAWGETKRIWPSREDLLGRYAESAAPDDPLELIRTVILNHANSLKEHPLRVELLADEIMNPTAISDSLSAIRDQLGKEHQAIFQDLPAMKDFDTRSLLMVMMAAASFVSMRAAKDSDFMGEPVHSDSGWQQMVQRLERIVSLVALGKKYENTIAASGAGTEHQC